MLIHNPHIHNAYICEGIRTPFGRYGGCLSTIRPDDLAAMVIRHVVANSGLRDHPQAIDEVILGNANQAGEDNRNIARMASLLAGLPVTVPGITVNRLCASGLEAVAMAARMIRCGEAEVVIAGGVESMSRSPFVMAKTEIPFSREVHIFDTTIGWRFVNPELQKSFGIDSMPETAENVAIKFMISREDQDHFAYQSQQKTAKARQQGFFREEILPVRVSRKKQDPLVIDCDEHPREDTTLEKLSQLPTPFREEGGSVTAGNSSGVNDGAVAIVVASERAVKQFSLQPKAQIVASCSVGVEPRIMGVAPITAVEKLLQQTDLTLSQIEVMELNEAFASQSLAVLRGLGIDKGNPIVNPNGGAISLGHPLGASGARLALTLSRYLVKTQKRYGIATLCVGVGQGSAMLLKRV